MTINKPALASIAALTLALTLAGCSSSGDEVEPSASSSSEATSAPEETTEVEESPTPEATEETEAPAEAADGTVAPGTTVAVGEEAIVSWAPASDTPAQPVSITVTSITPASIDDFAVVGEDFQAKLAGYTPYYITVEAKKVDLNGAELAYQSLYGDMGAVNASGSNLQTVSIIGNFEPCNTASLDSTFDSGTPQTFCYIMAGSEGDEIGGATFAPYDTDYRDNPVVWTN